jgi:YidC/Oxa1 family membrane protein insertase
MTFIKKILKAILYRPLFNALIFLVWLVPGHYVGVAIIVLTIIIRLILLPSSLKATRAQKKMRDLQPEIQKLQAQYKDDKQKQSQELMKFYQQNKINPLGSCLPLLIQLPILLILYYVFRNGLNTARFDLLYPFMPRPEFINTSFFGLNLSQPDRWILPVIAGILQFIQGWQLTPPKQPGQQQDMSVMVSKQMLYLMPVFTIFIGGRLPSALVVYWIITTLFAIGQQWWVFREKSNIKTNALRQISKIENKNTINNDKKEQKIIKRGVEVTVRRKK